MNGTGWSIPPGYRIATDFSAWYEGAYRLVYHPNAVYLWGGSCNGHCPYVLPLPQNSNPSDYRYPPFFLIFILPLIGLGYVEAAFAWDAVCFIVLLPLLAFLIWRVLSPRTWTAVVLATVVALFTLFAPLNFSSGGFDPEMRQAFGSIWFLFSPGYALQWAQGQTKVFELAAIFLSIYFIKYRSAVIAGFFLTLSSLDPRFTLLAFPLFAYIAIKRGVLFEGIAGVVTGVVILFAPFALYPSIHSPSTGGLLGSYIHHIFYQYKLSTFYAYEWIPFFSILSLTVAYVACDRLEGHSQIHSIFGRPVGAGEQRTKETPMPFQRLESGRLVLLGERGVSHDIGVHYRSESPLAVC
jgi:hypothetical protein